MYGISIKETTDIYSHCRRIILKIRDNECNMRQAHTVVRRLVIARLENRVCLINFRASMDVCFIAESF